MIVRILLLTFFFAFSTQASADSLYLNELVEKSRSLNLSADPKWLALVHYEKHTILPGYKSLARTQLFFNAKDGAVNPKSELEATLANFFNPEGRVEGESREPYQCAFKARFVWLDEKLNFDRKKMPTYECVRYDQWAKAIDAKALTLIFPSAYINNPASAFGHTLLRIDQSDQNEKNRLLAYTANFSAATSGEGGFLYALKGVFGQYPGFFSVAPYYEKVKKYSDMERRDIWEYQLNFSKQEVDFLLMHLWELRSIAFTYYYFDQNCSYYLLGLMEAVRPSLNLSQAYHSWVIPVDTVRSMVEKEGVVGEAVFRPSSVTSLQARINSNNKNKRQIAKQLAEGTIELTSKDFQSLDDKDKAESVDLAYEYLNFRIVAGKDEGNVLQQRAYGLLRARSALPATAEVKINTPKVRPDKGHLTSRVGVATGRQDGKWFYDLRFRSAYHDLLDPLDGFTKGAQIELFDFILRQKEEENLKLQRAMIVDIKSLSPSNEFLKPVSWNLDLGFQRVNMPESERALAFGFNAGAGRSWALTEKFFAYALLDFDSLFSQHFDDSYAVGLGPKLGIIISPYDWWQISPRFSVDEFMLGDQHTALKSGIEQSFAVGRNQSIRLNAQSSRSFGRNDNEISLAFDYYL